MFTRIIIALDLSESSSEIVAGLDGLHALGVKEVVLAHVIEDLVSGTATTHFHYRDLLKQDLMQRALGEMEKQKSRLEEQGFEASVEILFGTPSKEIARLAQERSIGLIIAGSRSASLARNILLGSTALNVLHQAPVPTLLKHVPARGESKIPSSLQGDLMRHVLFATDFSPAADRSLALLAQLAPYASEAITLCHVKPVHSTSEEDAESNILLEGIRSRLLDAGAKHVTTRIAHGDPAREIVKISEDTKYSLLVMGTQGKGVVEEFFVGSVSQAVARHTRLPFLLVPPRARISQDMPQHVRESGYRAIS